MNEQKKNSPEETRTEQKQNHTTTMSSDSSESKGDNVNCFECKAVDETPFYVTRIDDERAGQGYVILCMGLPANSKIFATREEAERYIERKPWDLISGLILGVVMKNNTNPFKVK